ncbi:MAG: PEP/pyruvate-binding domain-containing protein [bacterium]|nr:PEP/pyruvate-binding domain-containing protein [bacterium]
MDKARGGQPDDSRRAFAAVPWRELLEVIRQGRGRQFVRVSRKMLNHLCSIGLSEAQVMLAEVDAGPAGPARREGRPAGSGQHGLSKKPGARVPLEHSPLMTGAPFELAARYIPDEEISERLQRWLKEDEASFFGTVVADPRSTMPEIAEAIRRYNDVLRGRSGLAPSTLKSLRVSLIQRFLTEQLDYINVAKEVARITDFHDLLDRVIMTRGCYGKLGGKASGLLLAGWILEQPEARELGVGDIKTPRTWHVVSDVIMDFIRLNDLDDVMDQKYKDISQVRREYPNMVQLFMNSPFPPELVEGLARALDYFGDVPLIIRSSSLLEDRFGTAFSGKYKSLFLPNCGTREERLSALQDAVAEVWASILGPDPIEYRRERGLQEFVEEMGILIQEVVGTRVGRYWLPAFAGVAFSLNEFRWSPRIRREDGLVRLVPGLGTRAVDRVGDDFPVLAVPGQRGLRAHATLQETLRYSPRRADVINLETAEFETVDLDALLKEFGDEYPMVDRIFSVLRSGHLQQVQKMMMDPTREDLVADMRGLLDGTDFMPRVQALLKTLEMYLQSPVDIEFAHDGKDFYLVQCRPQAMSGDTAPSVIPHDVSPEDVLFTANRFVSNGQVPDITHVVYVVPEAYTALPDRETMAQVGRVVGALNGLLRKRSFVLIGPGRWGSRGDIKLGVSVTYADINNTAMLVEVARRRGDYVPDLSFGTHFFQDLVEAGIRYLPLYPDDPGVVFQEEFLLTAPNRLAELLPDHAPLEHCVRVIDIPAASHGRVLRIYQNADLDHALAVLEEPGERRGPGVGRGATGAGSPLRHARWRRQVAEELARGLDPATSGVVAVHLRGSVADGRASAESDLDLVLRFGGDAGQRARLEAWLDGWNRALTVLNQQNTGVRVERLLDAVIVAADDIEVAGGQQLPMAGED